VPEQQVRQPELMPLFCWHSLRWAFAPTACHDMVWQQSCTCFTAAHCCQSCAASDTRDASDGVWPVQQAGFTPENNCKASSAAHAQHILQLLLLCWCKL